MRPVPLTLAEIGMRNGTRFVIRTGVGLSFADKMDRRTRQGASISLLVARILLSIPMGLSFLSKLQTVHAPSQQIPDGRAA